MKKKGQEMSVSTLVLIVIGIVVLVMLILGFSMGWQNLWNKINLFQGGSVEDVINGCKIAATSDAVYSYCSEFKPVTVNNVKLQVNCQYPAVQDRLDKKLTCETGDKEPISLYCKGAKLSVNATVNVNDRVCKNVDGTNTLL